VAQRLKDYRKPEVSELDAERRFWMTMRRAWIMQINAIGRRYDVAGVKVDDDPALDEPLAPVVN